MTIALVLLLWSCTLGFIIFDALYFIKYFSNLWRLNWAKRFFYIIPTIFFLLIFAFGVLAHSGRTTISLEVFGINLGFLMLPQIFFYIFYVKINRQVKLLDEVEKNKIISLSQEKEEKNKQEIEAIKIAAFQKAIDSLGMIERVTIAKNAIKIFLLKNMSNLLNTS